MTGRLLVALAALYLAAALTLGTRRWDGFAPQPYRYVSPPPGVQNGGAPASASGGVSFANGTSKQVQIFTSDLQAQLLVPAGAFPPAPTGGDVTLTITPQEPPALAGLAAAGNAYLIQAKYADGSAVPEPWKKPVMIYLRFPDGTLPNGLYRLDRGGPVKLSASVDTPTLTAQGQSDRGGSFLAAGPGGARPAGAADSARTRALQLGGVGVVLVIIALVIIARDRLLRRRPADGGTGGPGDGEPRRRGERGAQRRPGRRRRR